MNESFLPIVSYSSEYHMDIFNRGGEQLFHTDNAKVGWDGRYNNTPVLDDSYIYVINLKNSIGKSFSYRGMVTLLR